ncbi:MAG: NAD-dependent epimerase/dehydratase family protein [Thermoanaerobaculia bacterium]
MRIFMTGVSGYIGRAVAAALRRRGHEVVGIARDPKKVKNLEGVRVLRGDLSNLLDHRDEIERCEAYVHTAFSPSDTVDLDEKAIYAFTRYHDDRYFLYTSGVWVLGNTGPGVADETTPPSPIDLVAWRARHEQYVLGEGRDNFPTAVLRPGCVYGREQSLLRGWFEAAEKGEPLDLVGDGSNRWAMVHVDDLADCYRLAIESRTHGVLHAVDDTRASIHECADAVIERSGKKSVLRRIPLNEARQKMGGFADALAIDQRVGSGSTRHRLGWQPKHTFVPSVPEQWKEWGRS